MRAIFVSLFGLFVMFAPARVAYAQAIPDPGMKVKLAAQYLAATHHADIISTAYQRQLKLGWLICKDKACQADLDSAIEQVLPGLADKYENEYAKLMAGRLSEDELRAAISWAQSPQGQALSRAQQSASDDIGSLGHQFSLAAILEVAQIFCPKHKEICTRRTEDLSRTPRK